MASNTNETRVLTPTVWKNSLASFFKILLAIVVFAVYLTSIIFFVYPQTAVKIFRFMNIKPAEEASLVQAYEKSGKDSDIYNLILFEQENSAYGKELYYINLLASRESYGTFCSKLDKSALLSVGSQKSLIPYICNTASYLNNQKVKCLWNMNSSVETFIYTALKGDYKFEYSFATYAELLNSNLSVDAKSEKFVNLLGTFRDDDSEITVEVLLDQRIEDLQNEDESETTAQKIIRFHSLSNLAKGKYLACYHAYGVENEKTTAAKEVYDSAVKRLNELIK
jgi:hypothetical protein